MELRFNKCYCLLSRWIEGFYNSSRLIIAGNSNNLPITPSANRACCAVELVQPLSEFAEHIVCNRGGHLLCRLEYLIAHILHFHQARSQEGQFLLNLLPGPQ